MGKSTRDDLAGVPLPGALPTYLILLFLMLCVGALPERIACGAGAPLNPLQAVDTSNPRATLRSFLDTCNEYYAFVRDHGRQENGTDVRRTIGGRILRCLDLSELAPAMRDSTGAEAAICLKEILDRIPLPADFQVPGPEQVSVEKDVTPLARWKIPGTDITICRIEEGDRKGEYLFSADTVSRATGFYARVKDLPYQSRQATPHFLQWYRTAPGWMISAKWLHHLPAWAHKTIFDNTVWQWFGSLAVLVIGAFLMFVSYAIGRFLIRRPGRWRFIRYGVSLAFPVAAMLIPLLVEYLISSQLRMTGQARTIIVYAMNVLFLIASIGVVVGVGNRIAAVIISSPRIHPRGVDAHLIRLALRFLSLTIAVVIFLEGGQQMGIPVTTLLAGAGVGGLAFALAAQDTVKNFFGSVMVLLDKPFRVGERIKVAQYDGVVQEIGLRSTRIRLLTGHLVTVPNEEMARSDIENVSQRPHIRRTASIRIPFDTPVEKVEKAIQIVRTALADHEGMEPAFPPRVFLNEFNSDCLNLLMIYWYHPPNYWDFLGFSERLNLRIMQQFEEAGIQFALPATTAFVASDPSRPIAWNRDR